MTVASDYWMDLVRSVGCIVCRRFQPTGEAVEIHHVAEGSGLRSDFSVAGLCREHHQGGSGLHGMGVKRFTALYRPPGENEYGLLVWVNEDIANHMRTK